MIAQIVSNRRAAGRWRGQAATGALEASASQLSPDAFAAADVSGTGCLQVAALGPATLSMIGRSLIRQGEVVFAIEVRDGRVDADSGGKLGRFRRRGPRVMDLSPEPGRAVSRLTTLEPVPAEGMVHIRYQADPERPWRGVAPAMASAAIAGRL